MQRHQVVTSLPLPVRDAIDSVASEAGVSRIVAVSDLTALALGRSDLTLRLPTPRDDDPAPSPRDVLWIASQRPDTRGWPSVTTLVPADLLPTLDDLVVQTGTSRRRIVANLVTHMVSRADISHDSHDSHDDLVWPMSHQGRFPLAI
jgi:hypothetical protein